MEKQFKGRKWHQEKLQGEKRMEIVKKIPCRKVLKEVKCRKQLEEATDGLSNCSA